MKKVIILCYILVSVTTSFAQPIPPKSIEDSVFGWYKVYHLKGAKENKIMYNRVYSIAQLSICDSLVNWIQESYIPKGGIGDVKKVIFPKMSVYSRYNVGLPQGYGVTSFFARTDCRKGKAVPIQEMQLPWRLAV